ncbi:WSC domain-containing protein [Lasiosphaeria miniovina]|uniref:WSC domain-containing protein n=1 Tax=Lasiosphaeria miniovina TaxID=1954250 RepID=A0AA39ZQT7_9PEZI|nr:WSC domain-containing protein [Lasiosphaeria miniovina]KAK0701971.1 WSC domain-containing protein [Lasiosphaeria miniovina]
MQSKVVSALLAGAAVASACVIPPGTLSNTITTPFRVQVQNASYPEINNQYMNLLAAGGGDQHLFVGPVGVPTYDLTLLNGVITHGDIRAVIGGEFSDIDHTTKMFMTNRGDPRAIYQPTYVCNPVTDALQIELTFVTMQNNPPGGWNCVRPTFDNAHEFRYYPPGNTLNDPNRFCKKVTLVAVFTGGGTTTSSPPVSSVSTPSSSSSSSSSSTSSSVPVNSNLPYTDMTGLGFRFLGCSPEERRVVPPDQPVRTLPSASLAGDDMTNEKCMAFCAGLGYAYAGSEYRRECWCGNSYLPTRQPATTLASLANCNFRCAGNAAQYCGGDSWLSLYQKCPVGGPCVNAVFT